MDMNETEAMLYEQETQQPPPFLQISLEQCFVLRDPVYNKVMARHATNLITATINGLCSPFSEIENFLIVFVIARNGTLHTPSNVLLACLAFSNLLVGLLVQPFYVVFRLSENILHFVPCGLRIVYSESFWVCYGVSFLTLSAISFERYIALKLHLRYKELVITERVLKVAVGIWLLDMVLTFAVWIVQSKHLRNGHAGILLLCLLVTLGTQIKIFWTLRRHQRQINSFSHVNRNQPMRRNMQRQNRLAVSITYIVIIYITCNIPVLIAMAYLFAGGHFSSFNVFSWTETIAFFNSLINPVICCWRNKVIRRAIFSILANTVCLRKLTRQVDLSLDWTVVGRGSNNVNRGQPLQEMKVNQNLTASSKRYFEMQ